MKRLNSRRLRRGFSRLQFVMLVLAIFSAFAISAGEISYTLDLSDLEIKMDTITAPDGNCYIQLSATDCQYFGDHGEPMIPYKVINFLVPTYSNNFETYASNETSELITKDQISLMTLDHDNIYRKAIDDYPGSSSTPNNDRSGISVRLLCDYPINGIHHIVSVAVPTVFSNSLNELSKILKIDIHIAYQLCEQNKLSFIPHEYPSTNLDYDINEFVVNPSPSIESSSTNNILFNNNLKYYYILSPSVLIDSFKPFCQWKRQKGYTVVLKSVEEILSDPAWHEFQGEIAVDNESHIRNWLRYEQYLHGNYMLMIVGDYRTSAPIRKFRKNVPCDSLSYDNEYNGENFVPSDMYFSDFSHSYELEQTPVGKYCARFFQEVHSPEIVVSRLLAYENKHIDNYTKKSFIYEVDPGLGSRNYLNRGLIARERGMNKNNFISDLVALSEKIYLVDEGSGTSYNSYSPTGAQVVIGIRNCGLISVSGHGSPFTIRCSGPEYEWKECRYIQALNSYTEKETDHPLQEDGNGFDNLNNYGSPSIFYTIGCIVSPFDNYVNGKGQKHDNPYNLGAAYTVAGDFGGPIFVGNSRNGYKYESSLMELNFGKQIGMGKSVGQSYNASYLKNSLSKEYYYDEYAILARCLIGDPDIYAWKCVPEEKFYWSSYKDGLLTIGGIEDSEISIYNGISHSQNISNSSSKNIAQINTEDFISNDSNDFMVSIFKKDCLPYFKLFANNSIISAGTEKYYFMRNANLTNEWNPNLCCFSIQDYGILNLSLTGDLYTHKAFMINENGTLNLESEGVINLSDETIAKGGKLSVSASKVVLDKGFTVEKGSVVSITVKK